jgi:hypothetical protein
VCTILAQNPRSTNSHFRPVVPGGHSPRPLVSPAVTADSREDNSANLAPGPTVPQVNCTAPPNVANGVHTPFLRPHNVSRIAAGGAAGGGAAIPLPPQPTISFRLILVWQVLPTAWRQAGSASSALGMLRWRVLTVLSTSTRWMPTQCIAVETATTLKQLMASTMPCFRPQG